MLFFFYVLALALLGRTSGSRLPSDAVRENLKGAGKVLLRILVVILADQNCSGQTSRTKAAPLVWLAYIIVNVSFPGLCRGCRSKSFGRSLWRRCLILCWIPSLVADYQRKTQVCFQKVWGNETVACACSRPWCGPACGNRGCLARQVLGMLLVCLPASICCKL